MKTHAFNWPLWAGLALSPVGFLSYPMLFVRWPATRDVPWVNVLLCGAAAVLVLAGARRAFEQGRFRAVRIVGSLAVAAVTAFILANFVLVAFVYPRDLPSSAGAPQIGQRAPAFSLQDEHGRLVSLSELLSTPIPTKTGGTGDSRAPRGVLLVFYMYSGCRACNSEFRGLQQNLDRFTEMGIRPVAISIDVPSVSLQLSQEAGYTFTFLSDPNLDVIRRYDVANGEEGARPAEFLLDPAGVVRWRNLTSNYYVRARPTQILDAAKALP
jgi:peroxiredoxin